MPKQRNRVRYAAGTFIIDGNPKFIRGAEYQYYRDLPEHWAERLNQIVNAGVNTITCYIPWRHHAVASTTTNDPSFDFTGSSAPARDLLGFLKLVADSRAWAIVKPGPFVHSELNIGGLPDAVSPGYNPDIEPMQKWDGTSLIWEYDNSILPAPFDPKFESAANVWLAAVGEVIRPFVYPDGPIIGIQVNDETLYCLSNAPPWTAGYETSSRQCHVAPPPLQLPKNPPRTPLSGPITLTEAQPLISWGRYQSWIRTETYRRYRDALNVDLPYLSNHAGVTPPIEENVPDRDALTFHGPDNLFEPLNRRYAEWWFAHNPIEADREIYHYGFISWLGVTPYNISDPKTVDITNPVVPNTVFSRYINTATRSRGVNMEENWGFATLYHPYSRAPFVPVFQSLVSIAGGATGYVVFCAVSHIHWDTSLDRITKLQNDAFPSDAPIGPDGQLTPMYTAMNQLNRWLTTNGDDLTQARRHHDISFAVYPQYAAVSSWIDTWPEDHPNPFQGTDGLEELSNALQEYGYVPAWTGMEGLVDPTDPTDPAGSVGSDNPISPETHPALAVKLWHWMDRSTQKSLAHYTTSGGTLYYLGVLPDRDWDDTPCTVLIDTQKNFPDQFVPLPPTVEEILAVLRRYNVTPRATVTPGSRAFVFDIAENQANLSSAKDTIIFFFGYDGSTQQTISVDTTKIEITAGGKVCGALRIQGDTITSSYIKGVNEVEDSVATVHVTTGENRVTYRGDTLQENRPAP